MAGRRPARRRHPRPRLPALRRAAPRPGRDHPGAVLAQPAVGVRHRPRRQGQDRADPHVRAHVPARGRERGRGGAPRQPRRIVDYDTYTYALRVLVMLIFVAAQAPELVVPRPAQPRAAAVLLPADAPPGLPAGQVAAFTVACLLMIEIPLLLLYLGTIVQVARRQRGLGPDQGADPRPARRAAVGGAARRDRAGARLAHRPPGLRDRHDRDLLLPDLDAGQDPGQRRQSRAPATGGPPGPGTRWCVEPRSAPALPA